MQTYKIMLVDDEPAIIEGLRHLIDWDEYGIQIVQTALNGIAALNAFEKHRVDIVITDIRMPKLDGIGLIHRIRQLDPDTKHIILSGYDDFSYTKESIKLGIENYLLKPINEDELSSTLISTIEKINRERGKQAARTQDMNIIRENILNRWVLGRIQDRELKEHADLIGLQLFESKYLFAAVRVIQSDIKNSLVLTSGSDWQALNQKVEETCLRHIPEGSRNLVFHDYDGDLIIPFWGNGTDFSSKAVHETLKKILSSFSESKVMISLGSLVSHPSDIMKGYLNAKRMLFFTMISAGSTFIDYTDFVSKTADRHDAYKIDLAPLKHFIMAEEKGSAFGFIHDLYEKLVKRPLVSPAFLRDITIEILYNILYMTNTDAVKDHYIQTNQEGFFNKIYFIGQMEELVEYVCHVIGEVMDYLSEKGSGIHPLVARLIRYVRDNCEKDISLKAMSHLFNVNTAYLGQLFMNETGEVFSNYLNRVRIEKAMQLLKTTNINAKEVSGKVGFTNPSYFYSVFKKITGMSSSEYKQTVARNL